MNVLGKFRLRVMNPDRLLFEGEVENIFVQGDTGEYEVLAYHYPILSLMRKGAIVIDWEHFVSIKKGIIKFFKNDCVAIVELDD